MYVSLRELSNARIEIIEVVAPEQLDDEGTKLRQVLLS
jgi:hypothetical protein